MGFVGFSLCSLVSGWAPAVEWLFRQKNNNGNRKLKQHSLQMQTICCRILPTSSNPGFQSVKESMNLYIWKYAWVCVWKYAIEGALQRTLSVNVSNETVTILSFTQFYIFSHFSLLAGCGSYFFLWLLHAI